MKFSLLLLFTLTLSICAAAVCFAEDSSWSDFNQAGRVAFERGQYAEAEKNFAQALQQADKFSQSDRRLAETLNNLALTYFQEGKFIDAEPLFKRSLDCYEKYGLLKGSGYAKTLSNLGMVYYKLRNDQEAERVYKLSMNISEKSSGPVNPGLALTLNNLGSLYYRQKKYDQAASYYEKSMDMQEKTVGPDSPAFAQTLHNLAGFYCTQQKFAQAEALYKRSLAIREKALPPNHPAIVESLKGYAHLLRKLDRDEEALALEVRAKAITEGKSQSPSALAASSASSPNSANGHNVDTSAGADYAPYVAEVERRLKSLWNPPEKKISSKVVVHFNINSEGKISGATIFKSSDMTNVDQAAMGVLATASLPPPPLSLSHGVNMEFAFVTNVHKTGNFQEIKKWQDQLAFADIADNHIGLAQAYEQANAYDSAENEFRKAIAMNPNDPYYKQLLEQCTAHAKTSKPFVNSYFNSEENLSKGDKALIYNGLAYSQSGDDEKAAAEFSKAIALNGNNIVAYNDRGTVYLKLKEYSQAIDDFSKAVSINPSYALAYRNRAIAYGTLGQYEKSIEDYSQAIKINPNDGSYYRGRGTAYGVTKQFQKAIDDYSKAIKLDPRDEVAYSNRGGIHIMLLECEQALADLSKAIELNPNDRDAHHMRAQIYEKLGKHDLAELDSQSAKGQ